VILVEEHQPKQVTLPGTSRNNDLLVTDEPLHLDGEVEGDPTFLLALLDAVTLETILLEDRENVLPEIHGIGQGG